MPYICLIYSEEAVCNIRYLLKSLSLASDFEQIPAINEKVPPLGKTDIMTDTELTKFYGCDHIFFKNFMVTAINIYKDCYPSEEMFGY